MHSLKHTIRGYHVELFCHTAGAMPHGFEVTRDDTTNSSGYHRTGGLIIEGTELVDYDGCFVLPLCVAEALELIGVQVSDACLSDAAVVERNIKRAQS